MPDILLIQPPIRDFYLTKKRTAPYGLTCIAAALIKSGFTVEIFDALATSKSRVIEIPPEMVSIEPYYRIPDISPFGLFNHYKHYGYSFEHIGKMAKKSGAFLVGISALFTAYSKEAIKTAETVKKYHPKCHIVFGGHHPTNFPENVLQSKSVDFAIRGDGEIPMPLLAKALLENSAVDSIPGIVFRKNDGEIIIKDITMMDDLDKYSPPATELIKHSFYKRGKRNSAMLVTSRGCPMRCTYCTFGALSLFKYRRKSIDAVVREIEYAVEKLNVGFLDFEDENLSYNSNWFLSLLNVIEDRFKDFNLEFRAMNGLFPPSLSKASIERMHRVGFTTLNLSLCSTSKMQLKRFGRPNVAEAFDKTISLAHNFHLKTVGYIIAGAPFQTARETIKDLLFLAQRNVLIGLSVFYPAPGSEDFRLCERLNLLPKHLTLMRSSIIPLSHKTKQIELITLLRFARLLNFIKSLVTRGYMKQNLSFSRKLKDQTLNEREKAGIQLLKSFLKKGVIKGITPDGEIFNHLTSSSLSQKFFQELKTLNIKGCGNPS